MNLQCVLRIQSIPITSIFIYHKSKVHMGCGITD